MPKAPANPAKLSDAKREEIGELLNALRDNLENAPADFHIRSMSAYRYLKDIKQALDGLSLQPNAAQLTELAQQIGSTTADGKKLKEDLEAVSKALNSFADVAKALAPVVALL